MTKLSFAAAFALGLAVLAWIGFGFIGSSFVPLAVTAVIAGVYLLGAWELHLSHWSSGTATLEAWTDWVYGGRYHHLFGRLMYGGRPVRDVPAGEVPAPDAQAAAELPTART